MGCEDRLVLAAKQICCLHGYMAEVLVLGVDHPPLAFHLGGFSGKSLHSDFGKGDTLGKSALSVKGESALIQS